jgi:hypothetical protein
MLLKNYLIVFYEKDIYIYNNSKELNKISKNKKNKYFFLLLDSFDETYITKLFLKSSNKLLTVDVLKIGEDILEIILYYREFSMELTNLNKFFNYDIYEDFEKKKIKNLNTYIDILVITIQYIYCIFTPYNLNFKKLNTPTAVTLALYYSLNKKNYIVNNKKIFSKEDFIAKYFGLICKENTNLNLFLEDKRLFKIMNHEYKLNDLELEEYNKYKIKYNILEKDLLKIKYDNNFYKKCIFYLDEKLKWYYSYEDYNLSEIISGGRIELLENPYNLGIDEFIAEIDIKSCYFNTLDEEFPENDFYIEKENNISSVLEMGFFACEVIWDSNELPVLGLDYKDRFIFPSGEFKGIWWHQELNLFLSKGGVIKKIYYSIKWKNKSYLFKILKNEINNIKEKISLDINEIEKFLNEMNIDKESTSIDILKSFLKSLKNNFFGSFNKNLKILEKLSFDEKELIDTKTYFSNNYKKNIFLYSIITSRGRIQLYKLQEELKKNYKILFLNTDSVYIILKKNNNIIEELKKNKINCSVKFTCDNILFLNSKNKIYLKNKKIIYNDTELNEDEDYFYIKKNEFFSEKKELNIGENLIELEKNNKRIWLDRRRKSIALKIFN